MNIYLESFGIFFKIGAFTIGGGYAMVPLIENEIVTKRKWIAQDDFIDSQHIHLYRIQIARYTGKYCYGTGNDSAIFHYHIDHRPVFPQLQR